jgi:SEC-C motif
MSKPGRNAPCPCGSGKKFKRCHGSIEQRNRISSALRQALVDHQRVPASKALQRERQQGFGKPIVSTLVPGGRRLVAVKNKLVAGAWVTFHDFLGDYLVNAMGVEWWKAEELKAPDERHPLVAWRGMMRDLIAADDPNPVRQVRTRNMTGADAGYLHAANDLFALEHNADLQVKLVGRLKHPHQFASALYEASVAAKFIRAGFEIEFQDEDDRASTHCEFVATFPKTGRKFSVEAKRRGSVERMRVGHLLTAALKKKADYDRLVFIDLHVRDEGVGEEEPAFAKKALRDIRRIESSTLLAHLPPAVVFLTNEPWDLGLQEPHMRAFGLVEGFRVPAFKHGQATTLHQAIDDRLANPEIEQLVGSMMDHMHIPVTFDGTLPAYAFNPDARQIIIGQRYLVPNAKGEAVPGLVTAACIDEGQKSAMCGVSFEDGTTSIVAMPLTDDELADWRRHPDTFFGEVGQRKHGINTPLEMFDFLMGSFSKSTREKLLELLSAAPDFDRLAGMSQLELARIYCERSAEAWFLQHGEGRKV